MADCLCSRTVPSAHCRSTTTSLARRPAPVNDTTEEVTRLLQPNADKKALNLQVEPAHEPACAAPGHGALHSILNNLAGNAIEFTEEGSSITVNTDAEACASV